MSSFLISFYIHNKTRKIKTLNKVSVVRDDNLIYSHEFHLIKKKTHFTRSFRLNTQILLMLLHLFLVFLVLIYFLIRPKYQMLSKSYQTLTMYVLLKMYGSKNFTFLLLCQIQKHDIIRNMNYKAIFQFFFTNPLSYHYSGGLSTSHSGMYVCISKTTRARTVKLGYSMH